VVHYLVPKHLEYNNKNLGTFFPQNICTNRPWRLKRWWQPFPRVRLPLKYLFVLDYYRKFRTINHPFFWMLPMLVRNLLWHNKSTIRVNCIYATIHPNLSNIDLAYKCLNNHLLFGCLSIHTPSCPFVVLKQYFWSISKHYKLFQDIFPRVRQPKDEFPGAINKNLLILLHQHLAIFALNFA